MFHAFYIYENVRALVKVREKDLFKNCVHLVPVVFKLEI